MSERIEGRSLYDEWSARRQRLARLTSDARAAIELRVLDYLLAFYRDSPAAQGAAWISAKEDADLNTRAMVVLHHLARHAMPRLDSDEEVTFVRSARDAERRVTSIVRRMANSQRDDAGTNETHSDPASRDLKLGPRRKEDPLNSVRMELASQDRLVRLSAMRRLTVYGTSDDMVLMADLLSLPAQADEHPQEREALAYTIFQIGRRECLGDPTVVPVGEWAEYRAADELVARVTGAKVGADQYLWRCPNCRHYVPTDQDRCLNCLTSVYDLIYFPVEFKEPD